MAHKCCFPGMWRSSWRRKTTAKVWLSSQQPALNAAHWPEERTQGGRPRQQCEGKRPAPGLLGAQRYAGPCAQLCLLWGLPWCLGNPLKLYAYVFLQIRKWSQKVRQPISGCTPGMWPRWLLSADVWDQALTLNVKTTLSMGRLPVRRRCGEGCDCWGRWRRTDTLRVQGRLSEMGLLSKEVWLGCQVHFCT